MDFPQSININVHTRIILTKAGAAVLNNYFRQYHLGVTEESKQWEEKHFPTSYKEGDVFETELHELFHIFGKELIPGLDTPFLNNEIELIRMI